MSKALKIPGVDFSAVALAQVSYAGGGGGSCTDLSLNKSSCSFEAVGDTDTLIATPTPADTSDAITWASSDENVATVVGGVVTIHGIGTATITATCGTQTATATVNQTSIKAEGTPKVLTGFNPYYQSGNPSIITVTESSDSFAFGNKYTNDDTARVRYGDVNDIEAVKVPYGATTLKVATENDNAISMRYMYVGDSSDLGTYSGEDYPKYIERIADVNSKTGVSIAYGKCVIFRVLNSVTDTPTYVYFE